MYQLVNPSIATSAIKQTNELKDEKAAEKQSKAAKVGGDRSDGFSMLYVQLVIDCCDLLIPGSAVGWLPVGLLVVGTATSISSILAGQRIWMKVQSAHRL